jgi:lipopolysaccharide transport system permease protein
MSMTPSVAIKTDLAELWSYRHLCGHLALSELRARFRRSHLGIVWAALQPLLLTVIMSVVLVYIFNQPFREFSVYVYSGVIGWELLTSAFLLGAASLSEAGPYLRQAKLPLALFPLKSVIHGSIMFCTAFAGYFTYCLLVLPGAISWTFLLLPAFLVLALLLAIPFSIISAITNMLVRDYQQAIGLILQALWYVSPIFIAREIFNKEPLATFTKFNFVAAYIDIFRDLVLYGRLPAVRDIFVVLVWAALFWALAVWMLNRHRQRLIYFL